MHEDSVTQLCVKRLFAPFFILSIVTVLVSGCHSCRYVHYEMYVSLGDTS